MQLSGIFRGITKVTPGNGSSALFWKDAWFDNTQDSPLMDIYPRAFSFCLNEDDSIAKVLAATDPSTIFSLPLSTQAREEIKEIQEGLPQNRLAVDNSDVWECLLGRFSSKKFYNTATNRLWQMRRLDGSGKLKARSNSRCLGGYS